MKSRRLQLILVVAISAGGIFGAAHFGEEFWDHIQDLSDYAGNGDWKQPRSSDASLREQIEANYGDAQAFVVHSVSNDSYDLDPESAAATIRSLGHGLPRETYALSMKHESLVNEYRALLTDAVASVSKKPPAETDRPELLREAEGVLGRISSDDRAWSIAATPKGGLPMIESHLSRALSHLANGTKPSLLGPYSVGTQPDVQRLDDSTPGFASNTKRSSVASLQCTAEIRSISGTTNVATADVFVYPRFLHVSITRQWLDESFLDHRMMLTREIRDQYFARGGRLRLIPTKLIVSAPAVVELRPRSERDKGVLGALTRTGGCCVFVCPAAEPIALDSHRSEETVDGRILAYATNRPTVLAIVSRRWGLYE